MFVASSTLIIHSPCCLYMYGCIHRNAIYYHVVRTLSINTYIHTLANYVVLHILCTHIATLHVYSRQYEAHHPLKAFACVAVVHVQSTTPYSITLSDAHFSANYMVSFCCHIISSSVFSMITLAIVSHIYNSQNIVWVVTLAATQCHSKQVPREALAHTIYCIRCCGHSC